MHRYTGTGRRIWRTGEVTSLPRDCAANRGGELSSHSGELWVFLFCTIVHVLAAIFSFLQGGIGSGIGCSGKA